MVYGKNSTTQLLFLHAVDLQIAANTQTSEIFRIGLCEQNEFGRGQKINVFSRQEVNFSINKETLLTAKKYES